MDSEEKLMALKKAYADIILGISKEAAARVMASEKKSMRYEHELKVAKEEGVRILLRLKKMMDSQISEAEASSLHQQKKIDELEAQLQEAEDIVRDLREELGDAQAELERVKNEPDNACSRDGSAGNATYSYELSKNHPPNEPHVASDVRVSYMNQRNECGAYVRNRDLPSIILRGKELGLYRNGCTQRIRACDRSPMDRDSDEKTDKIVYEHNEGKDISEAPAAAAKTASGFEKKLLADIEPVSFNSFPRKRRRGIRRRKSAIPLGQKQSGRHVIPDPLTDKDGACPRLSEKAEPQTQPGFVKDSEKKTNCDTEKTMRDDGLDTKMDVEKVDDSLEVNTSKEVSSQTVKGRVIKHTFQRKRKRQMESNSVPEIENETGDGLSKLKRSKSSLLVESSRDSRRLAQVARQLISLSETKWWH